MGQVPSFNSNGEFVVTCGIGSCGFSGTVFAGSQLQALDVARDLRAKGVTDRSLCPWECMPTRYTHGPPSAYLESQIRAGYGMLNLNYPGLLEGGFPGFVRSAVGSTPMTPLLSRSTTRTACQTLCDDRKLAGCMHAVWLADDASGGGSTGQCMIFLATRTQASLKLWQSFFEWARTTLSLAHVRHAVPSAEDYASYPPGDSDLDCSTSCFWCAHLTFHHTHTHTHTNHSYTRMHTVPLQVSGKWPLDPARV